MEFGRVEEREASYFLPVVKRLPVAIVEGNGVRVRDIDAADSTGWRPERCGHKMALVE